jgi:protein-tyrosine phosphatase
MDRHIPLEGITNFRDFGGYVAGGRRLKRGVLYRSAQHSRATDADLAQLAGLGVKVVVDLRRTSEREREPSRRWDGFDAEVIESDVSRGEAGDWRSFMADGDITYEACHRYMVHFYEGMPFLPRHVDLYSRYFQALADSDGAMVVHCAAGKDRTGVICALTHHLAGVGDEDLVEDYMLTNKAQNIEARLPAIREAIAKDTGQQPSENALRAILSVSPDFLESALTAMKARHGSLDGYLEQVLGVDAGMRQRIHAKLLD